MSLLPLKLSLNDFQQRKGLKNKIQSSLICEYAKKLLLKEFGKTIERFIKNITLVGGSLRIATDSSNFKQAISNREKEFIENINLEFKNNVVKKITYKS